MSTLDRCHLASELRTHFTIILIKNYWNIFSKIQQRVERSASPLKFINNPVKKIESILFSRFFGIFFENLIWIYIPSVSELTPQSERLRFLKTSLSRNFGSNYSSIRLSLNSSCILHKLFLHNAIWKITISSFVIYVECQ